MAWRAARPAEPMTTAEQFLDWQFSYDHPMSDSWREFLASLTPHVGPDEKIVLSWRPLARKHHGGQVRGWQLPSHGDHRLGVERLLSGLL